MLEQFKPRRGQKLCYSAVQISCTELIHVYCIEVATISSKA